MEFLSVAIQRDRVGLVVGSRSHLAATALPADAALARARIGALLEVSRAEKFAVTTPRRANKTSRAITAYLESLAHERGTTLQYFDRKDVRAVWLRRKAGTDDEMAAETKAREFKISDQAQIEAIALLDVQLRLEYPEAA